MITNRASRVVLQLDIKSPTAFAGMAYSLFYRRCVAFDSVEEMLFALEELFDTLRCPQSTVQTRTFFVHNEAAKKMKAMDASETMDTIMANKQKATFVINVLYRQNASWQGTINWLNEGKTQSFRSTLELIRLMDSALLSGAEVEVVDWTDAAEDE